MNSKKKTYFPGVMDGDTFTVAGMEFIKFPANELGTPVMMRDVAFRSQFGSNNDLSQSDILRRMKEEILPKITEAVGEQNVLTFKTDLTTLDRLKPYADLESKISVYTLDFYRNNVEICDRYPVDCWCWMATPESAKPHDDPWYVLCDAPSGCVLDNYCNSATVAAVSARF